MKLNIHFFIITIIAYLACINDILIYTLDLNYNISIIITILIIAIIMIITLKKRKICIETNFDKSDLVFFVLLSGILIKRIGIPDFSYDTLNYHIYLQENPFTDKINFDFFPARTLNSFLFPLGDRMFYIFRNILGYRLGTILSYYAVIVIFYQIKLIVKNIKENINKVWLCIISSLIILIFSLNEWIGTYYVDILSTVFVLQLFLIAITEHDDLFMYKEKIYFIGCIIGISIGIKLPNLLIEIPILLYILKYNFKSIKNIRIVHVICFALLCMLPFLVYMIDNIIQTGNPIFPYYNAIFKSQFFGNVNWQVSNFGVPNAIVSLIWPIVTTIFPQKGYEIIYEVDAVFGAGFICAVIFIIYKLLKRDIHNKNFSIVVLVLLMTVVWSNFMMGYVRYAISLVILYWIIFLLVIQNFDIPKEVFYYFYSVFIIIVFCVNTIMYDFDYIIFLETNNYTGENYILNLSKIFFDKDNKKIHIDGVWVAIGDESAVLTLVREKDTPIYNLDKRYTETSEVNMKMYNEKLINNNLYTIMPLDIAERKINGLNYNHLKIVSINKIEELSFGNVNNVYYLVNLQYDENFSENTIKYEDESVFINGIEL